jgi:hypothetical protein
MSTILKNVFSINGVIDTAQNVLQNMNTIASAAGAWVTYDINQGKWAVIINQTGSSISSFNDSNIIGSISVSSTGLTELYNSVEIEFPNADVLDQKDYIKFEIDAGERFPNEPNNELQIKMDIINSSVQAELIASRELKQSRVDKIIEFRTDFTKLGLKAGDLIDVTNSALGWTNKVFRIMRIVEEDSDDGVFSLSISALEYNADVYSTTGLTRTARSIRPDIPAKKNNTATTSSDNQAALPLDLTDIAKSLGLLLVFNSATGRYELSQGGAQVTINASYAIVTWTFAVDGEDLDIRARLVGPNVGQDTVFDCLGFTTDGVSTPVNAWGPLGAERGTPGSLNNYYIVWGGDNTGDGQEAVFMNLNLLKANYPSRRYFMLECYGNWFNLPSIQPVQLNASIYEGGTVSRSSFSFTAAGYAKGRTTKGLEVYIDSNYGETAINGINGGNAVGNLMGYFVYDAQYNTCQFVNTLTGIA